MTLERVLSLETASENLRRFSADAAAFSEMEPRLTEQYPEQWIAVWDGEVVAHDPDFETVLSCLVEEGLQPGQTVVRFVTAAETLLIL